MVRKFKIERPPYMTIKKTVGIYKMTLGTHFYIGQSYRLLLRFDEHKRENEVLFRKYGNNPLMIPDVHYKQKMFMHLVAHPEIDILKFQILQYCRISSLDKIENKFFRKVVGNPFCLNNLPATKGTFDIIYFCTQLVK